MRRTRSAGHAEVETVEEGGAVGIGHHQPAVGAPDVAGQRLAPCGWG